MSNTDQTWEKFYEIVKNYVPEIPEEKPKPEPQTIAVGDYLVAQWGYEANNVNFFKVLKRTKHFVEIAEVNQERVEGDTGIYMGIFVKPGTTWKNWSLWADRESYNFNRREDGEPIKFRRKIGTYTNGDEYANLSEYAHMVKWDGKLKTDYNHH